MTLPSHHLAGFSENRAHLDFYPTPEWATEALMAVEQFDGVILEPACGDGAMFEVLQKYNDVVPKDIIYGQDFLKETDEYDNIVTNPPFRLAEEFVRVGKRVAQRKIALFLKLAFLEGQARKSLLEETTFPLARVHVFSKRVTFHPGGIEDRKRSGTMAFAWFIWQRDFEGKPTISWI